VAITTEYPGTAQYIYLAIVVLTERSNKFICKSKIEIGVRNIIIQAINNLTALLPFQNKYINRIGIKIVNAALSIP
jgi:hypothetical protein